MRRNTGFDAGEPAGVFGQGGPAHARALYARVSTHDQQTLGLQVEAMTAYLRDRGWDVARQVKDIGSGARGAVWADGLLKAARRREIDVVMVWRLDRWGRSLADLVVSLRELSELGVGFVSLTHGLDRSTDPALKTFWRATGSRRPRCIGVAQPVLHGDVCRSRRPGETVNAVLSVMDGNRPYSGNAGG